MLILSFLNRGPGFKEDGGVADAGADGVGEETGDGDELRGVLWSVGEALAVGAEGDVLGVGDGGHGEFAGGGGDEGGALCERC